MNNNDKTKIVADLNNALSPFFNLATMVNSLHEVPEDKKEKFLELTNAEAKLCCDHASLRVKELINEIYDYISISIPLYSTEQLNELIEEAIAKYPEKVAEYKSGKTGLLGLFMGEMMKLSKGKADPKEVNKLLKEKLEQ